MKFNLGRRTFLKKSAAVALTAPLIQSLEEYALAAQESAPSTQPASPPAAAMPLGTIGKVRISRLICGGNLISGYAHSRDLIYVSPLLNHYFTDDKVLETWALSERHGINTMILNPSDTRAAGLYEKYRARGGRIQYLAQLGPSKEDLKTPVKQAKDAGAVGAFLLGNVGDAWAREGDVKLIGELLANIKEQGLIAGVAGHELRTVMTVEKAGLAPDFYMKTLHDTNYWSKRRPYQMQEVIDNYGVDNYWCMDPKQTVGYMSELKRPWIAYKVLAAGAIHPRAGFKFAFESGADFVAVGVFDFQIAEDAAIAGEAHKAAQNREREWCA
ncbi:MAG: hypothetical protein ABSF95_14880 [Verrucomicrobiota bacterium]|jgi:hypothetical protein